VKKVRKGNERGREVRKRKGMETEIRDGIGNGEEN
jgi:hypothetical protein